jgi:uncharacterized protein YjbI with pentapeptide repeats
MSLAEVGSLPGTVFLRRITISDVDLARSKFDSISPSGCTFVRCDLRDARVDRRFNPLFRSRHQNVFRECRFDGADLRELDPGASRFESCTFDGADLAGWNATMAEFIDCHFAGRVERVRFYARPWGPGIADLRPARAVNEFRGNDFRDAELVDVAFLMGVALQAQRWPDGDQYVRLDRIHQRLTRGHAAILRWKDLEIRGEALAMMQDLSLLYRQQNDVIARRAEPRRTTHPETQDKVWRTLAAVL